MKREFKFLALTSCSLTIGPYFVFNYLQITAYRMPGIKKYNLTQIVDRDSATPTTNK